MSEHWTLQWQDGTCLYTVRSEAEAVKWCNSDNGGMRNVRPVRVYMAHELAAARDAALDEAAKLCDDVYERSASRDDGDDPFENGIKWATDIIAEKIRALKKEVR